MCEALHISERGFGAEPLSVVRNSLSLADLLPVLVSVARLRVRGPGLTFLSLSKKFWEGEREHTVQRVQSKQTPSSNWLV